MRHTREEIIERLNHEFELLDGLISGLTDEEWERLVPRPESRDPWTVKDTVAHITHWKADVARAARRQPRPTEERGLGEKEVNRLIYLRWRDRAPQDVLAWHRQVQQDMLSTLNEIPEEWFSARERRAAWPYDLEGHSADHRVRDIERALAQGG